MAPAPSTLAAGVGLGLAAASLPAFVPQAGPSGRPKTRGARFLAPSDAPSDSGASGLNLAGASAAVALGMIAVANNRKTEMTAKRTALKAEAEAAPATESAKEEWPPSDMEAFKVRKGFPGGDWAMVAPPPLPFAGGLIGGESAFSSGPYNFDPLNLSGKFPQLIPWFREAELKHGRISMLAWIGMVVPDVLGKIPFTGKEDSAAALCYQASVTDALKACFNGGPPLFFNAVAPLGGQMAKSWTGFGDGPMYQILIWITIIELCTTTPKFAQGCEPDEAGDYQLGAQFLPKDEGKVKEMKLKELKNGRLAMLAFGGAATQAVLSGNGFPWLFAQKPAGGSSFVSSTRAASSSFVAGARPSGRAAGASTARRADVGGPGPNGYKMSKAVPFLPVSPALEGYVGEEEGFDPMGVSLAIDIRWLREAELKHARVCMLAVAGWVATDLGMRVPGEPFANLSTLAAHDAMVKFGSMPQMLVWIGYLELYGFLAFNTMCEGKTDRTPGDFGLRWGYPEDEKGQHDMQLKELRNGRLAMLAYSGIVTAAVLTGSTWPFFDVVPNALPADRCARAPALGQGSRLCGGLQKAAQRGAVSANVVPRSRSLPFLPEPQNLQGLPGHEAGFDPLGFTDTFDVRFMREAELKHGRVCMLATLGFVAQQWVTLPGFLPEPNSLKAVYTADAGPMIGLVFLAGAIESSVYNGKISMLDMFEDDRTPGDLNFGRGFLKGKSDSEVYDLKLKELNNGRLAMLAFGGMVHHNLVCSAPLFPLIPDGWVGPQYTWKIQSLMSNMQDGFGNGPLVGVLENPTGI